VRGQRIVSSCAVLPTRSSQFCYPALTRAGLRSGALRTVATATENLSGLKPTPRHVLSGAPEQAAEKVEIVVSIWIPRALKSSRNDKNKKLTARLKPSPFKERFVPAVFFRSL